MGTWKSFDELEECLTINELNYILEAQREKEFNAFRFQASLKGINLDGEQKSNDERLEEIKRRAEAKNKGISEEEVELSEIGIGYIAGEEGD